MTARRERAEPLDGVLVVDKPRGPTSHDVVARLRRALGTRAVGHAGTLDPAATGVLVVAIGEATKLAAYLTAHDKAYDATVALGRATTSLDAEGETTCESALAAELARELAEAASHGAPGPALTRALDVERARVEQVPPAFSAIHAEGKRAHELARAGIEPVLAARNVRALSITLLGASASALDVRLEVEKGYYVRAFARDLGATLGVPAHLASLRRTRSGPFSLAEAAPLDSSRDELLARVIPLAEAARRALASVELTVAGALRASQGKRLGADDFVEAPAHSPAAWLSPEGALVAIGERRDDATWAVLRGFSHAPRREP